MSLSNTIEILKGIEIEAKELFEQLIKLAELGKDTSKTQKNDIQKLADKLDENARKASRERCEFEIDKLSKEIDKIDCLLAVPGMTKEVRDIAKAERGKKVARRGRLRGKLGLDFGGILTATDVQVLDDLVVKAKKEVQTKRKAAAFLHTVLKIADISLSIASKLAI